MRGNAINIKRDPCVSVRRKALEPEGTNRKTGGDSGVWTMTKVGNTPISLDISRAEGDTCLDLFRKLTASE